MLAVLGELDPEVWLWRATDQDTKQLYLASPNFASGRQIPRRFQEFQLSCAGGPQKAPGWDCLLERGKTGSLTLDCTEAWSDCCLRVWKTLLARTVRRQKLRPLPCGITSPTGRKSSLASRGSWGVPTFTIEEMDYSWERGNPGYSPGICTEG